MGGEHPHGRIEVRLRRLSGNQVEVALGPWMPEYVSVAELEPGIRFTPGISTSITSNCLERLIGAVEKVELDVEMEMEQAMGRILGGGRAEAKPG
jgi:hypothetical protein